MAKNWAIIIGVNDYVHLGSLKWAIRDAQLMANFLVNKKFFGKNVFKVLHFHCKAKDEKMKPTRANIRHFLRSLKEQKMNKDDNFWFFFSGHGRVDNGQDYLMPLYGNTDDIKETAISTKFIIEQLRESHAGNIFLFLDACRTTGNKNSLGIGHATEIEAKAKKIVTFFSCSPNEVSYEINELKQSSFSYALLKGLKDKANWSNLEKLESYVQTKINKLNHKYNKQQQNPYLVIETIAEISKAKVSLFPESHYEILSGTNNRLIQNRLIEYSLLVFSFLFLTVGGGVGYHQYKSNKNLIAENDQLINSLEAVCNDRQKLDKEMITHCLIVTNLINNRPFKCVMIESIPTTVIISPKWENKQRLFIRWSSEWFTPSGWTPQKRCQEVTRRLNQSFSEGEVYVTHGIMNSIPVICTTSKVRDGCSQILFTLPKEEDPIVVLKDLINLSSNNFLGNSLRQ
ncbi:MAG: COP23 domain-containing protein [Crocosphaera sp.]